MVVAGVGIPTLLLLMLAVVDVDVSLDVLAGYGMIDGEIVGAAEVGLVAVAEIVAPVYFVAAAAPVVGMLVGVLAGAGEMVGEIDEAGFVAVAEGPEQVALGGVERAGLLAELEGSVAVSVGVGIHVESVVQGGKIEAAPVEHVAADSEEDNQLADVAANEVKVQVYEQVK
ncbi:hypothetical protein FSARC_5972 [Fusarium sarcochroum]|uniref:Uncharacterized protein n=1 Tax=Fusarium sarcochroum TaxID=1208366 RepID=A0A8H4TYI7_9HYPO|nr:hypothetical protein FSARC_5972 [Fusarium sarcochroum]